jgi:hypothetical protein
MTRLLFLVLMTATFFTACQSGETNTDGASLTDSGKAPAELTLEEMQMTSDRLVSSNSNAQTKAIADSLNNMIASSMLESVAFDNGILTVKYFDSADAFNKTFKANRQTQSVESFKQFWANGGRAEKVASMVPAEILRKFDYVQTVRASLPTGDNNISIVVTRDMLSKLIGKPWNEITANWDVEYTNTIVRIPEGRAKFLKEVGK